MAGGYPETIQIPVKSDPGPQVYNITSSLSTCWKTDPIINIRFNCRIEILITVPDTLPLRKPSPIDHITTMSFLSRLVTLFGLVLLAHAYVSNHDGRSLHFP